jgi:MFS transporter, DHA2 family, multidrug resistance protein
LPLLVQGVGMSLFFIAMLSILLDGVAPERLPAASGLSNFMRITAGAFAASIVTTFWDRHAAFHQSRLAEASSIYDVPLQRTLDVLRGLGLDDLQALAAITRTMAGQAYLKSALDYFWISGWLCVVMIAFVWATRRPQRAAVAAAD